MNDEEYKATMKACFEANDANGDGLITFEEYKKLMLDSISDLMCSYPDTPKETLNTYLPKLHKYVSEEVVEDWKLFTLQDDQATFDNIWEIRLDKMEGDDRNFTQ